MNISDQHLWEFIDGTLNPAEMREVAETMKTDDGLRNRYEELLSLDEGFKNLEIDEPSMGFARNVAGRIATEPLPSRRILPQIFSAAIFGFFGLSILALFVYSLTGIRWADLTGTSGSSLTRNILDVTAASQKYYVTAFLFADLILALYLGERLLRRKRGEKGVNKKIYFF